MEAFLEVDKLPQFDLLGGFEMDIDSSNSMASLEVAAEDAPCFSFMITKVASV